jgi:hypothetical protein
LQYCEDASLDAARALRAQGYEDIEVYTPYSLAEIPSILGWKKSPMSLIVGTCGFMGAIGGFCMQYFANVIHYPWNIGGKPMNSWPMWIPITFECGILAAALTAVVGMFALNKLPQPYHPVFNNPRFAMASRNRFFLCIEATDGQFDLDRTRDFMQTLGAHEVTTVAE